MLAFPPGATEPAGASRTPPQVRSGRNGGRARARRAEGRLGGLGKSTHVPRAGLRPGRGQEGAGRGRRRPRQQDSPPGRPLHAPEHGLHKHPQRLEVDPGDEGFAEVHLEPAQQRALRRQESGRRLRAALPDAGPRRTRAVTEQAWSEGMPGGQRKQRVGWPRPRPRRGPGARCPGAWRQASSAGQPPAHAWGHRRPGCGGLGSP